QGPGDAIVWYRRAVTGLGQSDPEAFSQFRARLLAKAAARNPRDAEPWIERGRVAVELRQWERAAGEFGKAIARASDNPDPWVARGRVLAELGRWTPAAADLARAIDLGAADSFVWYQHAQALLAAGDEAGYRRACVATLARFGTTENAYSAAYVALACV